MFDPVRAVRYVGRVLAMLLPVAGVLLLLALVTEAALRLEDWPEFWSSGRFWLAVLRDLLPGLAALVAALLLASRFAQAVHGIRTAPEARGFLYHRFWGLFRFAPWQKIEAGAAVGDGEHVLARAGGPGNLVVFNDSAVVLQQAGLFTGVQTTGFTALDPFEKVYCAVDLRPIHHIHAVEAMSKEGIPLTCEVDITVQIDRQGAAATPAVPFPVSGDQVFRAAVGAWVLSDDHTGLLRPLGWSERLTVTEADRHLRSILARYPLDEVIGVGGPPGASRAAIRQELQAALAPVSQELGAEVVRLELGDIRVRDDVTQQWLEAWQVEWEGWSTRRHAEGRAEGIRHVQEARTRAQAAMVRSLIGVLRPLRGSRETVTSRLVLSRLFMALSQASADPLTRVYLPREAVQTLESLKRLIL